MHIPRLSFPLLMTIVNTARCGMPQGIRDRINGACYRWEEDYH
ncbi:hypothetical protein EV698_1188 [Spiribacter vilamensis]|uniref:Uncharacterized protein n=1 Tax=Spiribacter vilamensis TaxID=531306 RepID=A0A4Q8D0P4_9GAMM|nr:hypothetical protein EV698_1188 [Spiribacter vilamensis]